MACELSQATRFYRLRYAREFLRWRFEGKRWDLTKLCFADFVDYVKFRALRLKPASVAVMTTSYETSSVIHNRVMISRDFFSVANNLGDSVAFNLESDRSSSISRNIRLQKKLSLKSRTSG